MSQKARVSIQRENDFQEMDAILAEAMASLDDRNAQVSALLQSELDPSNADPERLGVEPETPEAEAPAAEQA